MKFSLIALALAAAFPLSAQAGELSYSYIEGGYANSDGAGESADGFSLEGSVAFNEMFYGSASYRNVSDDSAGLDISLDETVINFGYHTAMSDKADFLAELGYVRLGVDVDGFGSDSADGYRVAAGFRGMLAPKFEGNIKAYYTNVNDFGGGEFGARIGGQFKINETWGIVASYDWTKLSDERISTYGIGVRASF